MERAEQPEQRMPLVPVQIGKELEDLLTGDLAQIRELGLDGVDRALDAREVLRSGQTEVDGHREALRLDEHSLDPVQPAA